MIIYTSKEDIIAYKNDEGINQSLLKLIQYSPEKFLTHYVEKTPEEKIESGDAFFDEKEHFVIGSATDVILTGHPRQFQGEFYVSDLEEKPVDTIMSIVQMAYKLYKDNKLDSVDITDPSLSSFPTEMEDYLISCADHHKYCMKMSREVRLERIKPSFKYFQTITKAENRTILSKEEARLIKSIVISLRDNNITGKYFKDSNDFIIFYQLPLYFTHKGIRCKALLDMLVIDLVKNEIYIIDLKTTSRKTTNFQPVMKQRRYDFQAAFYSQALAYNMEKILSQLKLDKKPKFTSFKFIVESTTSPGNPLLYTCAKDTLMAGKYGYEIPTEIVILDEFQTVVSRGISTKRYKGFEECLDEYKYYLENGFKEDKKFSEADKNNLKLHIFNENTTE